MAEKKLSRKEKFAAAQVKTGAVSPLKPNAFPVWWSFLPAIIGWLVYANTLGHAFALDDYAAILENNSTRKGFAALGEIFRTSYRHGYTMIADDLYRPLPKAIYAVCWGIWPGSPTPGHWINVLLFAVTCWFIFRFLAQWFPNDKRLALFTALLFAVHPLHSEVVANIKSMDELLGFLLSLLSLHFFLLFVQEQKSGRLIGSVVLLYLACCSKESAIAFLPLYPLLAWFALEKKLTALWKPVLVLLIPVAAFMLVRYQILYAGKSFLPGPPAVIDNMLSAAKDPLHRFSGAVAMLGLYGLKLIWPTGLSFDRSYPELMPAEPSSVEFILSALVYTALLIVAVLLVRRRSLFGLAILTFFVLVSVASNIFARIGTHYGERLLFSPSFAFSFLLALLLLHAGDLASGRNPDLRRPAPLSWGLLGMLLVFHSGLTIARNQVWKDNGTLYASGLLSAPKSARVHYYQGLWMNKPDVIGSLPATARDSAKKSAIFHLKKSVELYPAFSDAWTQLGVAYYRQPNYDSARYAYQQALRFNPYDPVTLNNLGTVFFATNRFNEAFPLFQEALRYKPDYADAWMNLGSCHGTAQQYDQAINCFQKAVSINPDLKQAWFLLGITYRNMGNEPMAAEYIRKAEAMP